ncbi:hypothetical protein Tco_1254127 [Tanacetum coccineum]
MPSSPSSPSSPTTHTTTPPQPRHHKGAFGFKPPAQGCVELGLKPQKGTKVRLVVIISTKGAFGLVIHNKGVFSLDSTQQGCVRLM